MTDLLVGSLMADGGLESALLTAVKVELEEIEYNVVVCVLIYYIFLFPF